MNIILKLKTFNLKHIVNLIKYYTLKDYIIKYDINGFCLSCGWNPAFVHSHLIFKDSCEQIFKKYKVLTCNNGIVYFKNHITDKIIEVSY